MPPKKNLKLSAVRLPACAEASDGQAGGFFRKNAFGLIQEYCTIKEIRNAPFGAFGVFDALNLTEILV